MRILQQLMQQRNWRAAEARISELRKRTPSDPQLLLTLSQVLGEQGRIAEAINALRQCIGVAPHHVPALVTLSILLVRSGDVARAIPLAQQAVQCQPQDAGLHVHLSKVWCMARQPQNALQALDAALRLKPTDRALRIERIDLLKAVGRHGEAAAEARQLLPVQSQEYGLYEIATLLSEAAQRSAWGEQARLMAQLPAVFRRPLTQSNPTQWMMLLDDPAILKQIAVNVAIPLPARPQRVRKNGTGRITIGYLSGDIRQHPVAQMLISVLEQHDRERFEPVLLSLAPSDGSAVAEHARRLFNREVDLTCLPDPDAAQAIHEAGIDVLIDLMGLTSGNRIAILAHRPCPVQVLWLGCPITTGYRVYDAFLVDGQVAPAGYDEFTSEPLQRLPVCYHPISTGEQDGSSTLDRAQLGLPTDAMVVGIFPQVDRVRPPFIERVARTIAPQPHVHLWLRLAKAAQPQAIAQLEAWGIAAERIHVIPRFERRADYLQAQRLADLLVDSFPYGGHSTTGEALAMGVPVLCRRGASIHSRVAVSMLYELGLDDLVAASEEAQMQQLQRLLADAEERQRWRARFAAAASQPAIERHIRLTRALEDACSGLLARAEPELPGATALA